MNSLSTPAKGGALTNAHWWIHVQRLINIAIIVYFVCYSSYVLMLGKLFSPSVTPPWYRDLGIIWDLADYTIQNGNYQIGGYFFPPSNAILFHLYGLINRDIAFRIYLVLELAAVWLSIWAWSRLLDIRSRPDLALILFTAFLASYGYIHIELGMHNENALTFCLVSLALAFERQSILSSGCYAFSLALKPYSSVLILPWMIWRRNYVWAAAAIFWIFLWFVVLPACWFGLTRIPQLYHEWVLSVLASANDPSGQLSIRAGVATLTHSQILDPKVGAAAFTLQAIWIAALAVYFLPSLRDWQRYSGERSLCDYAAILLIGLPLGNNIQPARQIVFLASMLIISAAVFRANRSLPTRAVLIGILIAIGLSSQIAFYWSIGYWALASVLTLPNCLLALIGLSVVRAEPRSPVQG